MKKILIYIETEDEDTCGVGCAFLDDDWCDLFNIHLDDTELEDGYVWQDGQNPTKQRDYRCKYFDV